MHRSDHQRISKSITQELKIVLGLLFWLFVPPMVIYALPAYFIDHFLASLLMGPAFLMCCWGLWKFEILRFGR